MLVSPEQPVVEGQVALAEQVEHVRLAVALVSL